MMKIRYNLQYVLMAIIPPQGIHFFRGTGLLYWTGSEDEDEESKQKTFELSGLRAVDSNERTVDSKSK